MHRRQTSVLHVSMSVVVTGFILLSVTREISGHRKGDLTGREVSYFTMAVIRHCGPGNLQNRGSQPS